MKVHTNSIRFDGPGSAVSIGVFDGIHRGHRRVLAMLREEGLRLGLPTALVTFDPHPRAITQPSAAPPMLSTLDERLDMLAQSGDVDHCVVLRFDEMQRRQTAGDFVRSVLVEGLRARALVVGENFACGRARQGNVPWLEAAGRKHGFVVNPIILAKAGAEPSAPACSSSETRRLIRAGEIEAAAALLERPYALSGTVLPGSGSASIDTPVALPSGRCTPAAGLYAGEVGLRPLGGAGMAWRRAHLEVHAAGETAVCSIRMPHGAHVEAGPGQALGLRFHRRIGRAAAPMAHPGALYASME
ncbi:FMN adenylyltransferase [Variovorax sp. WS11]|uniref:FAD synthetase family protein n=1 Tax=Variovorax sp. WS11 TaxID=1105204 RepID=UPI000D0DCDC1|nr:FAD synthetase family protein [Variovorax sp. WS11]NDZ14005.1 FAD synthetase family protein [Variovorax sp. WS11]PSL80110.1 FMN adenylyltransferase [Variovorax sp. WS11]